MDLLATIGTDGALILLSAAGLLATAVAIVLDTRHQARYGSAVPALVASRPGPGPGTAEDRP